MGKTVMRVIVSKGVMTVINDPNPNGFSQSLGEFYQHIDEANRIMDGINQQNNYNLEILRQANEIINNTKNIAPSKPIPQDASLWEQFLERGKYSTHNPQTEGLLDPDRWANFTFDIIKKTMWLLWNSFIGISHWLCLLIAIAGIIAYIAGYKKGGIVSVCSILFYILLKMINMAIGG
jgi:hypothetical protein